MTIEPSDAEKIAKRHLGGLDLEYQVELHTPKVVSERPADPKDKSKGYIPNEYKVPISLTDKDGTTLKTELYVDAQTGELRDNPHWNPTKGQYEAGMKGRRQHYVLIVTEDERTAKALADKSYNEEGVVSSAYGHRSVVDQANSNAVMAFVHGQRNQSGPIDYKVKPEEEQRRKTLENCLLRKK
ncbi:MAG TPA: hypothetical protein VJB13_04705 [Candidatus Nanoarchaeia archaeon]|nr:hypothetical protein [Candidatus Nanoarchaeia archaeon]